MIEEIEAGDDLWTVSRRHAGFEWQSQDRTTRLSCRASPYDYQNVEAVLRGPAIIPLVASRTRK